MLYNKNEEVFYNKVQVLNRDISIQVIRLFAETITKEREMKLNRKKNLPSSADASLQFLDKQISDGIRILDALAATGLRSIRYLKEIPGVSNVTINDIDVKATTQAKDNVVRNNVLESRVTISNMDASLLMYQHRDPLQHFDVIDLDPYGTVG